MTVSTITVDRRKLLLTMAAGLAATATAGFAIAAPVTVDPIFAAIDAHRQAVTAFETIHATWVEEALFASNGAQLPLQEAPCDLSIAFSAQCVAANTLIGTAPTSHAGLQALERYLLDDSMGSRMARQSIWYPSTLEGITFTSIDGSQASVDWLISKRAAEIDQAA